MVRSTLVQNNFTSGEMSPQMRGRSDLVRYGNAVATMENFIAQKWGGARRRSGTRFIVAVKSEARLTRLIPFVFSTTTTYVVELGHQYARFLTGRGQLVSGTPVEVSTPWQDTQLREIKFVQSADVLYLTHPDVRPKQLNRTSATTFTLTDFDFKDGPWLDVNTTSTKLSLSAISGSVIVTADSITGINGGAGFIQSDIGRLIRWKDDAGNWTWLTIIVFSTDKIVTATIKGPNASATTGTVSWRLGAWSDTDGWPFTAVFHQQRLWFGGTNAYPQTLYASQVGNFDTFTPTAADGTVRDDDGLNYTISDDQVNVVRHLISDAKGLIIMTESGEFTAQAASAFAPITPTNIGMMRHSVYGSARNVKPWRAGSAILINQASGRKIREFVFKFEQDQFTAPDMTLVSEHILQSIPLDSAYRQEPDAVAWYVRTDGQLAGMTYEREEDIVAWHRHIFGGSFAAGDAVVESIAVVRDGPGDLLYMTVKRTINGATHRYIEFMEDYFDNGDNQEDGYFVDSGITLDIPIAISAITTANPVVITTTENHGLSTGNTVRIRSVKGMTQINGITFKIVVVDAISFKLTDNADDSNIDGTGYTAYDSEGNVYLEVSSVSNLTHLEGQQVKILVDGATHPDRTVSSGAITLDNKASKIHVGLGFTSKLVTLPVVPLAKGFDPRSKRIDIVHALGIFHESLGGESGLKDATLDELILRDPNVPLGSPPPLFTGVLDLNIESSAERDNQFEVLSSAPLPFNLLSVILELNVGEQL